MRSTLASRNASRLVTWIFVGLVGCAHAHAPELRVSVTAGRSVEARGGRAWHQAG